MAFINLLLLLRWRAIAEKITTILAIFLCQIAFADAATPSYVGDVWGNYVTDYIAAVSSEAEAVALTIAREVAITSSNFCSANMVATTAWEAMHERDVEGVVRVEYKGYSLQLGQVVGGVCKVGIFVGRGMSRSRIVCRSTERFDEVSATCLGGSEEKRDDSNPENNGASCPACGMPINPMTGNMWHLIGDYRSAVPAGGLAMNRMYNSAPVYWDAAAKVLGFGVRWSSAFDARLRQEAAVAPSYSATCWRFSNGRLACPSTWMAPSAIPGAVSITRGDGKKQTFIHSGSNWTSDANVNGRISAVFDAAGAAVVEWRYLDATGDNVERYDANGLLLSIATRSGATQRLTYSDGVTNDTGVGRFPADAPVCTLVQPGATLPAGRLLCVSDDAGRQLQFRYDAKGRIVELRDPLNQAYLYDYDGPSGGCVAGNEATYACKAGNLTRVTYPDGKNQTYFYNESSRINNGAVCGYPSYVVPIGNGFGQFANLMTGLVDENGVRQINWTYDCNGLATSSAQAGGVNKVVLSYTAISATAKTRSTTVTHTVGPAAAPQTTTRLYGTRFVQGVGKNTAIDQPCVECGPVKARTYDVNGNVATSTDFNGAVTSYTYDLARNLETSRTEAVGTAQARTIVTTWHPGFRLPASIGEPGRDTRFTYDANGNLLQKSVAAGGATRTWRYTYNGVGQVLTATGPRTDISNVSSYSYDAQGNLASITNAAGHVTLLSDYDANGRVGRITDPNGLATEFSYSPRGWLLSSNVEGALTTYSYDGVGQMTGVTGADNASINYSYDDAQRLTGIADGLGNTISYTLDLTGKRIGEQVNDPAGTLSRRTTRVYDLMNRLQQVTGGRQ